MLNDPANNAAVYSHQPPPVVAPAVVKADPAIAVLPFENLSDSKDNAYLADGIQDDVVKISPASVPCGSFRANRPSAFADQQVHEGDRDGIGGTYILGGSLRREANLIRLNAHLIDVRTDTEIWAKHFNVEVTEILKLQGDLASEIVPALQIVLSPGEKVALATAPTASAAAYDLYLQARRQMGIDIGDAETLRRVQDLLERAVAADPGFVRAWVALSYVHRFAYFNVASDHTDARIARAEQAIAEARRLAPDAPEVLVGLGQIRHYCYKDYDGAIAFYRQALATHPNYPGAHENLAYLHRRLGHWTETLAEFREAWRGAPENRDIALSVHRLLVLGQRFPEALEVKRQILSYWPLDRNVTFALAQDGFHARGDTAELEQWLAAIPVDERETAAVIEQRMEIAGIAGDENALIDLIRRHGLTLQQIDAAGVLLARGEQELLRHQLDGMKREVEEDLKEKSQSAGTWSLLARYHALGGTARSPGCDRPGAATHARVG